MERFSNKGGCRVCEVTRIEVFKRRDSLGYIDKRLWLFKTVIPPRN